jgi:hypothetical protein
VDADVASKVSSTSGGCAFLGTMPGSLLDVKNKKIKFCNKFKTVFQRREMTEEYKIVYSLILSLLYVLNKVGHGFFFLFLVQRE